MDNVYVRGVFCLPCSKDKLPKPYKDIAFEVFKQAVLDAGLTPQDIDGIVLSPPMLGGVLTHFMHAHHIGHYFGKDFKVEVMVENGGSTAALALRYGILEIMSGRCNAIAVVCMDERADRPPETMEFSNFIYDVVLAQTNLYGPYDSLYGIGAPIPYYAMAGQRYMIEKGVSRADLNFVPVRLRENSSENEKALLRDKITPEDVENSKEICPPLYLHDCSIFASGAACVILTSEEFERANPSKKRRVLLKGYGEYHTPSSFLPNRSKLPPYYSEALRKATQEAFSQAKIGPSDVDVAEIYGVFSTTELTILEDMGFFEEGRAVYAFRDNEVGKDAPLYVDPSGGRIGFGHPAGATPLIEVCEVVAQLRGECGQRQKKGRCDIGVAQAEHGMLNGAVVIVFEGK